MEKKNEREARIEESSAALTGFKLGLEQLDLVILCLQRAVFSLQRAVFSLKCAVF